MRLEIKATEQEIAGKSIELLSRLETLFRGVAPDTAELLRKAVPDKEATPRYPVLQDLLKQTSVLYTQYIDRMLVDISAVLDRSLPSDKI